MRFMIHACPKREWYVNDYLIPSMLAQGIPPDDIEVWMDRNGDGNLLSCMNAFFECGKRPGGTWHLQDDVLISSDFARRCAENDEGLVCGFGCGDFGPTMQTTGSVPRIFLWYSFQCIRIPNELAGECAEWFFNDAAWRDNYRQWVIEKKNDDSFFYDFVQETQEDLRVTNLRPNIVEHVDYLIGGSMVNRWRGYWARSAYWEEEDLVEELADRLHVKDVYLLYRQREAESRIERA